MSRFVLSPLAQGDLNAIWDYTVDHWGSEQAEQYIRLIARAIEAVAEAPKRGKACGHIRQGYRKYPAGSHVIFYKTGQNGIDVVRILHSRMDFERHFDEH